jgi:hypothetical protein
MADVIWDARGLVCGWLQGTDVYDLEAQPRALASRGAIFSYEGAWRGRLEYDFFWDTEGRAVAFMSQAGVRVTGGQPPLPGRAPTAPAPPLASPPPHPSVVLPGGPVQTAEWSMLSWEEFLG